MDFLYSGVADYAGWVIAHSGEGEGEGEGVGDSIKEIDDILRAYACAFGGDQLGVVERLGCADEDFLYYLSKFKRTRIDLSPLACRIWLIATLTASSASDSFD
jgi:hypothetical protein